MKTRIAVLSACLLLMISTHAQVHSGYAENVTKGNELYNSKDYRNSAKA